MSEGDWIEIGIVVKDSDMGNSEVKRRKWRQMTIGNKKKQRRQRVYESLIKQRKEIKPNYETRSEAKSLIMK